MNGTPRFILIDDNFINSFITEKLLKTLGLQDAVTSFQDANQVLEYIRAGANGHEGKIVLLVDLHMPIMSGFSFLDTFEQLPENIRAQYVVYIVTSSINPEDVRQASNYSTVKKFVSKPLTASVINGIIQETYS